MGGTTSNALSRERAGLFPNTYTDSIHDSTMILCRGSSALVCSLSEHELYGVQEKRATLSVG